MISDSKIFKPVIVLGAGGHAKVLVDALLQGGREIIGMTAPSGSCGKGLMGVELLGDDDSILQFSPDEVELVNGIGGMPGCNLRRELEKRLDRLGFVFSQVIHPSAVIANQVEIDAGVQIMAGTVIQPGVRIGRSSIINTRVSVDHDCQIQDYCHLAPGVTLSGNVIINQGTHVGTGASIIQGINIGRDSLIAAGAAVYKNVPDNTRHISETEPNQVKESI